MFSVTKKAASYIQRHGGNVLITMAFEPSGGGCSCRGDLIWGSYTPEINLGKPDNEAGILHEEVDGITIWYHSKLGLKPGYDRITISVRTLIVTAWLEMEGAKGYAVLPPNARSEEA